MAATYVIKVMGYNGDAKKTYTKNFSDIPETSATDESAQRKMANRYAALTNAVTTTAKLIKTSDIDLG